jgi:formylglycine-generating enzyme required for sulfatase activity
MALGKSAARAGPRHLVLVILAAGAVLLALGASLVSAPARGRPPATSRLRACLMHANSKNDRQKPMQMRDGCFVEIPAATFHRGAQRVHADQPGFDLEAADDEAPVREISLDSYWMLLEEVTTAQYAKCVSAGGCRPEDVSREGGYFDFGKPGRHQHPVNGVTWRGADDYCRWIGARLPTEAEWEYAARGPEARLFPWGGDPPSCDFVVMTEGGQLGCGHDGARDGLFHPKSTVAPFFLQHMSGNVWEWVADWYAPDAYAGAPSRNPQGPVTGDRRVLRGGAWTTIEAAELRGSARAALAPDAMMYDVGFRCAADAVAPKADPKVHSVLGAIVPSPSPSPWAGSWTFMLLADGKVAHRVAMEIGADGTFTMFNAVRGVVRPDGVVYFRITDEGTFGGGGEGDGRCAGPDRCEGAYDWDGISDRFELVRVAGE